MIFRFKRYAKKKKKISYIVLKARERKKRGGEGERGELATKKRVASGAIFQARRALTPASGVLRARRLFKSHQDGASLARRFLPRVFTLCTRPMLHANSACSLLTLDNLRTSVLLALCAPRNAGRVEETRLRNLRKICEVRRRDE